MEIQSARREKAVLKIVLWTGGLLLLFIVGSIAGAHAYAGWQERRALRRAEAYISGGDYRLGSLSARRAVELNENSVPAARLLARIAERTGDRTAIDWRRKVVQLQPTSIEDLTALADAGLQFNNVELAKRTLESVPSAGREIAVFQAASARLAQARHNPEAAATHWERAVALAPEDGGYRLQLALARLASLEEAKAIEGRRLLEGLRANAEQRAAATRALIVHAVARREDARHIRALAAELQGYPEALFSDRILYLDILRQLDDPDYITLLTDLEHAAVEKPVDLAALLSWMKTSNLSALGRDFAQTLPPERLLPWPVPLALAEIYGALAIWPDLEKLTASGDWGDFDFLRRAAQTRALRAQDKTVKAEREWAAARKAVAANPQRLLLLTQAIAEWGWQRDAEELLWEMAKQPISQFDVLYALYQRYTRARDATGLYRVLARLVELEPENLELQNNLAQVGLLLRADEPRAHRITADLHQKEPRNGALASMYAFSLYRQEKYAQAVAVMTELDARQLEDPSLSLYYGIFLAAAGEREKARGFLRAGAKAPMFPQEKQLFEAAARNAGLE